MELKSELEALGFEVNEAQADVVVVGGGGAASRAAVSAAQAGAKVIVLAKAPVGKGGSTVHGASEIMSMGASGYGSKDDAPEIHYRDTMQAATGFIDPKLVRVLAEDAPARIRDLIEWGVPFDRIEGDKYKLIQSDFGSFPRALGVAGKTGKAFVNVLAEQAQKLGVKTYSPVGLVDLLRDQSGAVVGVLGVNAETGALLVVRAGAVILGTGGAHGLFAQQVSTNEMIGDGQAICYRHGAELVNMEFHQFGPAMVHPYVQLFSKSCFVLHPKMLNSLGREFLSDYLPEGTSAEEVMDEKVFPFTISNESRYIDIAIASEIKNGRGSKRGAVYFSFDHVDPERLSRTIPNTMRWMAAKGLDPRRDKLEVGIAFQCLNGGVRMTDPNASSTLSGLFVIGELAGGVRGPDRPGGNSLAEGQVFGHRAGSGAAQYSRQINSPGRVVADEVIARLKKTLTVNPSLDCVKKVAELRTAMQENCLVEKDEQGLSSALRNVVETSYLVAHGGNATPRTILDSLSLENMCTTAEIILRACLRRKETRSSHFRTDYLQRDDQHYGHSFVMQRDGGDIRYTDLIYPADEMAERTSV
jgi:fumarate reductase (CoM/CoB) subunit A